jgi:hypothetical protein
MTDVSKGNINEKVLRLLIEKVLIEEAGIDKLCKYYKDKVLYLLNEDKKSYTSSIMMYANENNILNFMSLTILLLLLEEQYEYVIIPVYFTKNSEKAIIFLWVENKKFLEFRDLYISDGFILYNERKYKRVKDVVEQIKRDYREERKIR